MSTVVTAPRSATVAPVKVTVGVPDAVRALEKLKVSAQIVDQRVPVAPRSSSLSPPGLTLLPDGSKTISPVVTISRAASAVMVAAFVSMALVVESRERAPVEATVTIPRTDVVSVVLPTVTVSAAPLSTSR